MTNAQWARSRGEQAEQEGLRRGAWYRVVEDAGKAYVILDVHHVEIRVDKHKLEIRGQPPKTWSVVRHPYLVCPGCHARRYTTGEPKNQACPECGNTYAIDWKDSA